MVRPVRLAVKLVAVLPLTMDGVPAAGVPYEVVKPHSKETVVLSLFAMADPLRVGGCVYRDGETGKRYCPNECRNLGE